MLRSVQESFYTRELLPNFSDSFQARHDLAFSPPSRSDTFLNPSNVGRENILLEGVDEKLVEDARLIADALIVELKATTSLYKKLRGKQAKTILKEIEKKSEGRASDKYLDRLMWCYLNKSGEGNGLRLGKNQTNYDRLRNSLNLTLKQNDLNHYVNNEEFLAIATYFCVNYKENKKGFLKKFPDGFVNLDSEAGKERLKSLIRFLIVNKLEITTASGLENIRSLKISTSKYLSPSILKDTSSRDAIELAYFGCTKGADPIIRPWLIYDVNKWVGSKGESLIRHACAWMLEEGVKVYDRQTDTFDIGKIESINWTTSFYEQGLAKMLEFSKIADTPYKAIELGAKELSGKQIFGFNEDQVLPWKIRMIGKWSVKGKKEVLIDIATKYLVENILRKESPQMFSNNGKGGLLPRAVVNYSGWLDLYNGITSDCLRSANLSPLEALKRVYPKIFGVDGENVKPWEMSSKITRRGREGYKIFRQQLAYNLGSAGFGRLDFEGENLIWKIDSNDVRSWYENNSKDKPSLSEIMSSKEYGMTSAFRNFSQGVFQGFTILLSIKSTSKLPFKKPACSHHVSKNLNYIFNVIYPDGFELTIGKRAPVNLTYEQLNKAQEYLLKSFPNFYLSDLYIDIENRDELKSEMAKERDLFLKAHNTILNSIAIADTQVNELLVLATFKDGKRYAFNDLDLEDLVKALKNSVLPLVSCQSNEYLDFCEKFLSFMNQIPAKNLRSIIKGWTGEEEQEELGKSALATFNDLIQIAINYSYHAII